MPRRHSPPWTRTRMARLIRKKCARSLIVVKAVVLISVDPVKVGPVLAIVKTHADPAKATGINLYLNAATLKAC